MSRLKLAIQYSLSDGIPVRSTYVALVVGTILNLINQGDALFGAMSINWTKIVLTYFVPYAVSTYGAVSYRLARPQE
ncbi:MAG: nitrate/nitrite transporter NrtS [Bradyrhizobium sp.]|uniref:nitrate/nitrite transporter NrtS n=1 Tax=Bradyrhizobium sp. TaxID=376 RepID=UPI0025C72A6A|nr:nitrate/nitrite transporter NrtS [Bradyrhizobium sp.]MBI5263493.1 nitrate/nitrite transporter NrtS [Bradyrhizobium sp.]